MEKGQGPPQDMAAPPYPGPPLNSAALYPPQPVYPIAPQPGFVQYGTPQPANVVPVTQVVVIQSANLTEAPGLMKCPFCQTDVITHTTYKVGLLTWVICGVLTLFICWLCCFIPFCVDGAKDVEHHCPTCHRVIHVYKRM